MTDPIERAVEVARRLTVKGLAATQPNITAELRALDDAPPDPYAAGLALLRAATATPESRFEDEYKATRLRAAMATHAALAREEPARRLTTAELAVYTPPDSYAAGLAALRAKVQR